MPFLNEGAFRLDDYYRWLRLPSPCYRFNGCPGVLWNVLHIHCTWNDFTVWDVKPSEWYLRDTGLRNLILIWWHSAPYHILIWAQRVSITGWSELLDIRLAQHLCFKVFDLLKGIFGISALISIGAASWPTFQVRDNFQLNRDHDCTLHLAIRPSRMLTVRGCRFTII
jgi:hypothetical protein